MKGPGILIALAGKKPKGDEMAEPKEDKGSLSAAKALLKAIKADDAEAVDEALALHYELCCGSESEDEDD